MHFILEYCVAYLTIAEVMSPEQYIFRAENDIRKDVDILPKSNATCSSLKYIVLIKLSKIVCC